MSQSAMGKPTETAYRIDPRKNWEMLERRLAEETDPATRRNLETIVKHSQSEALPDFEALMATVSERAHYHSFATDDPTHSPRGKDGVAAYYKMIVETGCHLIEHHVDRVIADRNCATTEGVIRIAYPHDILRAMGYDVSDVSSHYMFESRLMIVWEFDEEGLVLCEDSYSGQDGFEGIAERPISMDEIFDYKASIS